MNMQAKFIAFDLETTGLSPKTDQIIEFGAIKFTVEKKNGMMVPKILGEFESLVNPNMMIPPQATRVNNITDDMVANAPTVDKVLRQFTAFCGQDTYWVAHNADYAANYLRAASKTNPQFLPTSPIFDSLKIARTLMSASSYRLGELAKTLKFQNQISLDLDSAELHRALYDCEVLAEVFVALLRRRLKDSDFGMASFLPAILKIQPEPIYLHK